LVVVGEGVDGGIHATATDEGSTKLIVEDGGVSLFEKSDSAIDLDNKGGQISGQITGDVVSNGRAIDMENLGNYVSSNITKEDIDAIGEVSWQIYDYGDYADYYYYDEATKTNYWYSTYQGTFQSGNKNTLIEESGDTTLIINGNVNAIAAENQNYSTNIANINTRYDGSTANLTIKGNATSNNENGYADGININAYDKTTVGVNVTGGITVSGEEDRSGEAISVNNFGSDVDVNIGGSVSAGSGISVSNNRRYKTETLQENDISAIKDKATPRYEGSSEYSYVDESGKAYDFYLNSDGDFAGGTLYTPVDYDGSAQITVQGNVNATSGSGISVNNADGTVTVDVGGKITSQGTGIYTSENNYNYQWWDKSKGSSDTSITVKGEIESEASGINASETNGTTVIKTEGGIKAGNDTAINASVSGEGSKMQISVGGNVEATSEEEDYHSYEGAAVKANNTGADLDITVNGNVTSAYNNGIRLDNDQLYDSRDITAKDVEAIKGKGTEYSYSDGTKWITYTDDNGVKYEYYLKADGTLSSGTVKTPSEYEGTSTFTVKGSVDSERTGVYVDNENGTAEINVGKDIKAGQTGIYTESDEGTTTKITTGGNITAVGTGVNAKNDGGTTTVTAGGNITATSEKGSAKGVYAKANGGDSELTIDVAGDISATGAEKNRYETYGIDSQNTGSEMAITVGGDVSSSSYGISAINNGMYTQKAMKETDVAAIKDKARLTYTQDNGNKGYYYKDENGNEYSYTVNGDGSLISGTVKTPSKEESNTSITVKGSVNAGNSGLSTINNKGTMSTDIGKDVTASGEYSTYGVSANDYGGETDIKIGGNVTSVTTGLEARGVNLHTNDEDAVLNLSVAGSVIAEATGEEEFIEYEGEEGGYYRRREVRSLLVDNDAGTVNATVAGDVSSNQEGVYVNQDRYNDWRNITQEEASAIVEKSKLTDSGTGEDEEGNTYEYKRYTYTDEDGYEYNFTIIDGKFDWGEKQKIIPKKAVTNIEIGGNVDVSNQEGVTRGLYADIDNGEATINIKGTINAEGVASLEDDYHGREYVDGIRGEVYGANSELTINVEGGITQKSLTLLDEDNGSAISVGNDADDDGLGKLTVTVMDDVTATGTGIYVNSGDHDREYLEGTAVINEDEYLRTQKYACEDGTVEERKIYYNQAGDFYYDEDGTMWKEKAIDEGFTKVKVVGDVHGDDNGIHVDEGINAAVIVDGTLTGDNSVILLSNDIIDDNMVLTVWEVIPDADDNIVERVIGYDEDGKEIRAQDRDTELQIQYIIRINPADAGYITTEGTTDYEGYKVAREGDTVTLRLNIPAGYVVDSAFGDLGQNFQLLQDANGNYYLVVPRGGAVLLSLKMHRVAARTAKVTYDPNGGVVGGHDQAYTVKVILNKNIELPTPDEREGYEFVGWYGADYGKDDERWTEPSEDDTSIVKAGATVKVEKDITYTAVWKTK